MLLDNEYVVITSVDFTKAFDRVRHHALSIKYLQLDLQDHIHNWLMDYFKGRGHLTTAGDVSSLIAWINASIVRGSGVGPPSYVVEASDLHPRNSQMPSRNSQMIHTCWWALRLRALEQLTMNLTTSSNGL